MIDAPALRALSDLAGPERAFLTVYLDHGDDASVLDADLARIRALLSDQPVEAEHFEESLAVVRRLLGEHAAPEGGSLAAFASWAAGLARAYPLPEPVGSRVWMGDAPYVRPAYEMLDEHETYAVVVLDNTSASVYLVAPDEVDQAGRVRGDVKNRVKKGGWSQKRYARRRDKQVETYASEVADGVAALADDRPFSRLVLIGSDEPVQAVTEALRTDLADLLAGTGSVDGNASEAEALDAAAEIAEAGEREAERELWLEIREQGMGPGLSAFGATSVLKALTEHRAEAVLVDREAAFDGTKCRSCEAVVHGTPRTCGVCGSSDVFRVDLVEVMTEQAARTGAEVDFADPFPALAEVGGVAALLRYSLAEEDPQQEERERRERAQRERERREAEPPAPEAPALDEADSQTAPPVEPTTKPVAEPAAEPTADLASPPAVEPTTPAAEPPSVAEPPPVAEPPAPDTEPAEPAVEPAAEPSAKPRLRTNPKRASDRRPSSPPAVAEAPAATGQTVRRALGWGLVALGLFQVVLGVQELPGGGTSELLLGAGLSAIGATNLLPPQRKAVRLGLGAVGLLLAVAAVVVLITEHGP